MDADFWHQRWESGQIGFHSTRIHPLLTEYWPAAAPQAPGRVLVPLCGKSLDMTWLADQGHRILGSELSELAVSDFFANLGLSPTVRREDALTWHTCGPYEIACGDFFALGAAQTGDCAAAFDRAALVALPPRQRAAYVDHLHSLLQPGSSMLLVTLVHDGVPSNGPPFSVSDLAVAELFEAWQRVTRLGAAAADLRGRPVTETAFHIVR